MRYLLLDTRGRMAAHISPDGGIQPVIIEHLDQHTVASTRVTIHPGLMALRVDDASVHTLAQAKGAEIIEPRRYADHPVSARALALIRNREQLRYDPTDGFPIDYDDAGIIGHGIGGPIFPRIDPAVIGIVELIGEEKILLARNTRRPDYYSLIAGYVEAGESLEAAFIREVAEETGRTIHSLTYQGSQPWPASGSIMVGFHAFTASRDPEHVTDHELAETLWCSCEELRTIPLPAPGSIAYRLIDTWARQHGGRLS